MKKVIDFLNGPEIKETNILLNNEITFIVKTNDVKQIDLNTFGIFLEIKDETETERTYIFDIKKQNDNVQRSRKIKIQFSVENKKQIINLIKNNYDIYKK